jgi:hypothetical protein
LAILPGDSGIFPMIKSLIIASLFTSTILIGGASAQTKKMVCDEAQIAALERGAVAITETAKRDAAMKSASSMRDMMTKKDIAGCEVRMNSHVVDYGDVK